MHFICMLHIELHVILPYILSTTLSVQKQTCIYVVGEYFFYHFSEGSHKIPAFFIDYSELVT